MTGTRGWRVVDVVDQRGQFALGGERGEVRDLRFERADEIGDGIDDSAAEREHAVGPVEPGRHHVG